jgi:hypothetical protein
VCESQWGSNSASNMSLSGDVDDDNIEQGSLLDEQENGEKDNFTTSSHVLSQNGWQQQPSFYGPFDYDVDLINSVLLRGAGCPGVWNANTDSLWVALSSSSTSSSSTSLLSSSDLQVASTVIAGEKQDVNNVAKSSNFVNGDQEWLEKLAESVNVYGSAISSSATSEGKSIKSSTDQTVRTTRTSANNTVVTKKKVVKKKPSGSSDKKEDSQDVQDFFAGLLNK